jgi:hypothetical protein
MPRGERGKLTANKRNASTARGKSETGIGSRLAAKVRRRFSEFLGCMVIPAFIVGPILVVFLIGLLPQTVSLLHQETVIDIVVKSERITSGESGKYLVFGENEVYQTTDSFALRKLRSSDFYRDIEVGKTYRFTVVGWRIPLFSNYRNIVGFEAIEPEAE